MPSLFGFVRIVIILLLKQLLIRPNADVYQILEIIIDISVISIRWEIMYGIHRYVNYINVLIHIYLIVLQFFKKVLLYVICV